jgi:hypothetical protein
MEIDALYHDNDPEQANTVDCPQVYNEGLMEMSQAELKLMQDITLHQMGESAADTKLVLGRVWQRLEEERFRRKADIAALEQMYFGRPSAQL